MANNALPRARDDREIRDRPRQPNNRRRRDTNGEQGMGPFGIFSSGAKPDSWPIFRPSWRCAATTAFGPWPASGRQSYPRTRPAVTLRPGPAHRWAAGPNRVWRPSGDQRVGAGASRQRALEHVVAMVMCELASRGAAIECGSQPDGQFRLLALLSRRSAHGRNSCLGSLLEKGEQAPRQPRHSRKNDYPARSQSPFSTGW